MLLALTRTDGQRYNVASYNGHSAIVEYLINSCAVDINELTNVKDFTVAVNEKFIRI